MINLSPQKSGFPGKIVISNKLELFLKKNVTIGILIIDSNRHLLWSNDTFRNWFGKVGQKSLCSNIHFASGPFLKCPALRTFNSGKMEFWIGTANTVKEQKKTFRFTTIPIWNCSGTVECVLEIIEDIALSSNVEEALYSNQKIPPAIPEGLAIFCLDRSGKIISTNPEHLRLADAPKEKVIGLNWINVPKSKEMGLTKYLSQGLLGEPFELFNFRYTTYRGDKEIYMNIKGIPILRTDGEVDRLLCLAEDITAKIASTKTSQIVGISKEIETVKSIIKRIAPYPYPVLIEGESGTGKELIAQEIHRLSTRAHKPFVVINAATFQDELLESELFGYVKGAFTGANQTKRGLFEIAHTGTFFIDEIGEMSQAMQVKLLRILETGSFRPLGGISEKSVNVRIIAATNRELLEEVRRGNFRKDLYYRLNVIKINLPPLRQRKDDIPLLANHFLEQEARITGIRKKISRAGMACLAKYSWPGNVRELANLIKNLIALTSKEIIEPGDIPLPSASIQPEFYQFNENNKSLEEILDEVEKKYISEVLLKNEGDKSKAAKILGISLRSLYRKINHHGIK